MEGLQIYSDRNNQILHQMYRLPVLISQKIDRDSGNSTLESFVALGSQKGRERTLDNDFRSNRDI